MTQKQPSHKLDIGDFHPVEENSQIKLEENQVLNSSASTISQITNILEKYKKEDNVIDFKGFNFTK